MSKKQFRQFKKTASALSFVSEPCVFFRCIFAYGQTGSGKTFTIQGNNNFPGIAPRAINGLFALLGELDDSKFKVDAQSYMCELYNNQVYRQSWRPALLRNSFCVLVKVFLNICLNVAAALAAHRFVGSARSAQESSPAGSEEGLFWNREHPRHHDEASDEC